MGREQRPIAPLIEIADGWRGYRALPRQAQAELSQAALLRRLDRDEPLFYEDDPCEGLFVVATGEIKVCKISAEGREQILYMARRGRFITEGLSFSPERYPANAIAMQTSAAYLLPSALLSRAIDNDPDFARSLIRLVQRRNRRYIGLVEDLTLRSVRTRLAAFLFTRAREHGAKSTDRNVALVRDLTTETVAARLGTVREEISRALSALEGEGVISLSRRQIDVVDMAVLKSIAAEKDDE